MDRRDFLKSGAVLGVGSTLIGSSVIGCKEQNKFANIEQPKLTTKPGLPKINPIPIVRIGFVGVGAQGSSHVRNFLNIDGVEIKAICDIIPERVERMQQWVTDAGKDKPAAYTKGDHDFVRMCEHEKLDLVFTATPWEWHVPIALAAMKNGNHAALEVPAALNIKECWQLVEYAEKYKKHCLMMENVNYDRRELMVLNMVRQGVFGEIIHGMGGYLHDLRNYKLGGNPDENWRLQHSIKRNGNIYPTHGLGPLANVMNINRGDRFDYLVSMSSKAKSLNYYANELLGEDNKLANLDFALGDVNVTMIKTLNNATITLYHDTNLPRPYSRMDTVQGVKAISQGYPNKIHIEGRSPAHQWEDLQVYEDEYLHPIWRNIDKLVKDDRHGGMDFIEDYKLINALHKGIPTDMDVYDAVALSVVSELSEISVANGSMPVKFPDFTRGFWNERPPLVIDGID